MSDKRVYFNNKILPYVLLLPQLIITLIFFIWPAGAALRSAFYRGDAFGLREHFVLFKNFISLFQDSDYLHAVSVTLLFSAAVTILTLVSGLAMALLVNRTSKAQGVYRTLFLLPYAVAPAVAGLLWRFLFNPSVGSIAYFLNSHGVAWNYLLHGKQALLLVVVASAWQQFSYNFLFFWAGLKAIPKSFLEAAAIDGAGSLWRFTHIIFPLLSPTTFFLLIINLLYAFFDTFGVIQIITNGGPANATNTLVFKVYQDGFVGLDMGLSSAQSVLLMMIVIGLTLLQFRFIDKKVHYH